ncbi:MAG: tetratricopeptide repeat protein [Pleurocapsa sp.]
MLKLLKNLLTSEPEEDVKAQQSSIQPYEPNAVESPLTRADKLWQTGKLGEALILYRQAIQQNPESTEIYEHLSALLKQQGNIAKAYEQLATELKQQGKVEQAAAYYRQAIDLKTITGDTKEKLLKPNFTRSKNHLASVINLKDTAFSFQPLAKTSALAAQTTSSFAFLNKSQEGLSLQNLSPEQAKNVKWETAQIYLQQALENYQQQQWPEVVNAAEKALATVPNLAEAYKIKGNALQKMGQTAEAIKCYVKAVEIKPNLANVYAGIGDLYAKQQQWKLAIEFYQKAIIIKPISQVYRNLAYVLTEIGELKEAQINIERAVQLESGDSVSQQPPVLNPAIKTREPSSTKNTKIETYRQIAQQLEQQNRWQEATLYYRQALKLSMSQENKQLPPAQTLPLLQSNVERNLSKIKSTEDRLDRAIKRYQQQTLDQPNSVKTFTDLGNLYTKKRLWQEAINCYRQAIAVNPKYAPAHLNLARVFAKLGKQSEFIEHMEMALALKPNIASATDRFNLANVLSKQGKSYLAINSYQEAITLNPNLLPAYYRLGEILAAQEKYQKAVEVYQKAVELHPQEAEIYYLLGQQLSILKQWDKAVKAYSKVLQLQPRFPQASRKLNHALAEKLRLDLETKRKHK